MLDNLIHRLEISPTIVALIDSPNRLQEYAADARHGSFLVEELVPTLGWQLARALDLPPSEVHYTEDASVEAVRQVIDSHGH